MSARFAATFGGVLVAAAALVAAGGASTATALVVVAEDAEVTRPPPDFPYWQHIGRSGIVTVVYLGRGWVLAAGHAGVRRVELRGQTHFPQADPTRRLHTGGMEADLLVFRIQGDPGLPPLPIARERPSLGTPFLLFGCGGKRGAADSWEEVPGFRVDAGGGKCRWGANRVSDVGSRIRLGRVVTEGFASDFSLVGGAVRREAQAVTGDSGGGVFSRTGPRGSWELAGLLISMSRYPKQPAELVLHGNIAYIADLAHYRDQILEIIAAPRR